MQDSHRKASVHAGCGTFAGPPKQFATTLRSRSALAGFKQTRSDTGYGPQAFSARAGLMLRELSNLAEAERLADRAVVRHG